METIQRQFYYIIIYNKLYLNTVATELMCFYKYSKNVYIKMYSSKGLIFVV